MIGYDEPTVIVYHRCADFAAGSVFAGPGAEPIYWWALVADGEWRIWLRGPLGLPRAAIKTRIREVARLDLGAVQAARNVQDARAEAPDL